MGGMYPGITIRNSQNIKIIGNKITECGNGIEAYTDATNITVRANEIYDCRVGIEFDDSSHNTISKNTIRNGVGFGISLMSDSDNNTITSNTIKEFDDGAIYLDYNTDYNEICQNCLQGTIDDRGDTNSCFDNDNCPGIPGFSINLTIFALLGMSVLLIVYKKFKK
jgi:parallel beta-helix repeat protein